MKIAIQISGEFRLLYLTWPKFSAILQGLEQRGHTIDFFVHSWKRDETGFDTFPWNERGEWHKTVYVYSHNDGLNLYKPNMYLVEDYDEKKELHEMGRYMSMYYSIFMANEVRKAYEKKQGVSYDLVMRYRTDCVLEEDPFLLLENWVEQKESFLCIPRPRRALNADGPVEQDTDGAYCDWIAYGSPALMDLYCRTFMDWLDVKDLRFMPESLLAMQLNRHGITKETSLRRPLLDFYLIDSFGQIRNQRV
jgi:hypothetical protein